MRLHKCNQVTSFTVKLVKREEKATEGETDEELSKDEGNKIEVNVRDEGEKDSDSESRTETGSDKETDDEGDRDGRETEGLIMILILNTITF